MLDHLSLGVADLNRSLAFYDEVMGALGYSRLWKNESAAGYGEHGSEEPFAIKEERPGDVPGGSKRTHVAFSANGTSAVDAFHEAALANGGKDEGAPGNRPHYGDKYYAAFVTDPDGYRLEAVFHG